MELAGVSPVSAGDDVVLVQAQNSRLRPYLPATPAAALPPPHLTPPPRATIPRVTGQAGLLRVSSSFGAADAGLRAQLGRSVLRSSREPGSGCQTVPGGLQGRGTAGARGLWEEEVRAGCPVRLGALGLAAELGDCGRAPRA